MKILPAGTVKRVHVDRRIIANNAKTGANAPYYTIQTSQGSIKTRRVIAMLEFDQRNKQLSCGARAYGVTRGELRYE